MLIDVPFVVVTPGEFVTVNKLPLGPNNYWHIVSAPTSAGAAAAVTIRIPGQTDCTRREGQDRTLPMVDAFTKMEVTSDIAGEVIICVGVGLEHDEPAQAPPAVQRVLEPFGNEVSEGLNTVNAGSQAAIATLTRANLKRVWFSVPSTEPGPVRIQGHPAAIDDAGGVWVNPGGPALALQAGSLNTPTTVSFRAYNPGIEAVRVYYRAEYQTLIP